MPTVKLINGCLLATLLVAVLAVANLASAGGTDNSRDPSDLSQEKIQPMSNERFWDIINSTTKFEAVPERQIDALRTALLALPPEDIVAFEAEFAHQLKRSYTWDLWGAAYVIHGGEGDDGFEYFRRWLISKGRMVFEQALANPDSLADMLAAAPGGPLEFESFGYVARRAWSEKTGRKVGEMPGGGTDMIYVGLEPSGTKFDEDAAHLAQRYPKLWRRFGSSPLE